MYVRMYGDYHSLHVSVCGVCLIRKESENDCSTFIVLSLYENVKYFDGKSTSYHLRHQQQPARFCFVCVCASECLILKVKWFYAILIICVNEYEYLLDFCIAYAIELSSV